LALGHHPNYENEYAPSDTIQDKADRSSTSAWQKAGLAATALVLVSAPIAIWADVSRNLWVAPHVQITAHRGHARRAPENTLSALRKAIESGADYAEIDVQLTADGTIVLLHDRDLRRVAGDSRRIAAVTWDDLQDIDVGSWFNPIFADERIPTLAQAFDLVRGRMKLNIELKFYGPNPALASAVAQLIRDHQFEDNCVVTSFDYEALQQARKFCPRLRTGLIVARSLGNIARLQVNALSVRAEHLTDTMLRQAHLNNQDVFAWTVNEPARMLTLMRRGVDNLISSDPDLAIRMRNQWSHMSPAERLLTAARMLMALDP
jgi:glycerophosphoryl diester phosphodiesterase